VFVGSPSSGSSEAIIPPMSRLSSPRKTRDLALCAWMLAGLTLCTGFIAPTARRSVVTMRRQAFAALSWQSVADREGVQFVGGFVKPQDLPKLNLPEICLAGRSNVGKSSALNTLSGRRKKVAVVSKSPGRTRMLNAFRVGSVCTLVDLPGYGYAKVSQQMQDDWRRSIELYLKKREQLRLAILFVDAQREPQEADAQLLEFLEYYELATLVVGTKVDKLSSAQRDRSLGVLREQLELPEDQPIGFSSTTGVGKAEVWKYIERACKK
jgi:GTP-binding protein